MTKRLHLANVCTFLPDQFVVNGAETLEADQHIAQTGVPRRRATTLPRFESTSTFVMIVGDKPISAQNFHQFINLRP